MLWLRVGGSALRPDPRRPTCAIKITTRGLELSPVRTRDLGVLLLRRRRRRHLRAVHRILASISRVLDSVGFYFPPAAAAAAAAALLSTVVAAVLPPTAAALQGNLDEEQILILKDRLLPLII